MNNTVKHCIRKASESFSRFFMATAQTLVSVLRMCVLTSLKTARKARKYEKLKQTPFCYVLGNGPSLKEVLNEGEIKCGDGDMICVNMFCSSEYFKRLKPKFYLLCDGQYFNPTNDRTIKQVHDLIDSLNSVDWPLYLVIPPSISSSCLLLASIDNPKVSILRNNCTEVNGFQCFCHLVYSHRLGMPRCQTVINYALMTAINMKYEQVFLFGAEHSWSRDMWVGDDNRLYTGDPHLYKNEKDVIALNHDIASECRDLARVFETHKQIKQYSDVQGVKIINKTKGSFIDAYDRS